MSAEPLEGRDRAPTAFSPPERSLLLNGHTVRVAQLARHQWARAGGAAHQSQWATSSAGLQRLSGVQRGSALCCKCPRWHLQESRRTPPPTAAVAAPGEGLLLLGAVRLLQHPLGQTAGSLRWPGQAASSMAWVPGRVGRRLAGWLGGWWARLPATPPAAAPLGRCAGTVWRPEQAGQAASSLEGRRSNGRLGWGGTLPGARQGCSRRRMAPRKAVKGCELLWGFFGVQKSRRGNRGGQRRIELRTSRTLSENHTTRPLSQARRCWNS